MNEEKCGDPVVLESDSLQEARAPRNPPKRGFGTGESNQIAFIPLSQWGYGAVEQGNHNDLELTKVEGAARDVDARRRCLMQT